MAKLEKAEGGYVCLVAQYRSLEEVSHSGSVIVG